MLVRFDKAYKLTGESAKKNTFRVIDWVPHLAGDCIVIVTWDSDERPKFLRFGLGRSPAPDSVAQPGTASTAEPVGFSITKNVGQLERALQDLIDGPVTLTAELRNGDWPFVAERVDAGDTLHLKVELNADHREFFKLKEAELTPLGRAERGIRFELTVFVFWPQHPSKDEPEMFGVETKQIVVEATPCVAPPKFEGCLALDLGNTGTTLACLPRPGETALDGPPYGERSPNHPVIAHTDKLDHQPIITSAVRLQKIEFPETAGLMPEAKFTVGRTALLDWSNNGLLLGIKRMAVDPAASEGVQIRLNDESIHVDKALPAELLSAGVFRGFLGGHGKLPQMFAITYPTTFSFREAERLKQAIFDGIQRARGWGKYLPSATAGERQKRLEALAERIKLSLDEATAAAIYLLYRDVIEAAGGIVGFMNAYPDGMLLMLFDCGGGTTDIALVHAKAELSVDQETRGNTYVIRITVIGRTGHRAFGGDYVTTQACRLLKAHVAGVVEKTIRSAGATLSARLATALTAMDGEHGSSTALEDFLSANAAEIKRLVPTQFTIGHDDDTQNRREAAALLWRWADSLKVNPSDAPQLVPEPIEPLSRLLQETHNADFSDHRFAAELKKITLPKKHIDALINDRLDEAISKMNLLLENRLHVDPDTGELPENGLPPNSEVDWVYVVGNAARYPYVRKRIETALNVRFAPERIRFDDANAKSAVAMGACIALSVHEGFFGFEIRHDRDLAKRLPYDVLLSTKGLTRKDDKLYPEHMLCDSPEMLQERLIPVPPRPENTNDPEVDQRWKTVSLQRLWPGDKKPEDYMTFTFSRPIRSPLRIRYDLESHTFFMSHADENEVAGKEILMYAEYLSPIQSGKI